MTKTLARPRPDPPAACASPFRRPRPAGGQALALGRLALGCLALAGLTPAPSASEIPPDPDLSTEGMRRAGPFHLRPFVVLKDFGYDDNVRFDAREREGDATLTAGPGLSALILTGDRGGILIHQEHDYVAFRENTDLNHWNTAARARGVLLLKRLSLSLEDRFTSQRERPNTEIDRRLRRDENAVTLAARSLGSGRLGWRAHARHERIDYASDDADSEAAARRLDRDEDSLSLTGELKIRPKTTFTLEGTVESVEFDDRRERRDSRIVSVLPGFRFDPSASVQGELKIGVARLEAPDRPESDHRGTVGEGRLSARLGSSARLKGTFARELVFSTLAENLFFVGTHWSAAYEQFFSRRLSGEILYGRGLNHYPEEITGSGGTPLVRDDRFTTYQASVRYRANRRLAFTAVASRLERDSTDDALDRERNLYALGSAYDF